MKSVGVLPMISFDAGFGVKCLNLNQLTSTPLLTGIFVVGESRMT